MILLNKLDGQTMYLNEDLIESVEDGAEGQSAIHLINGDRVIVAHVSSGIVARIRSEKITHARKVFGPDISFTNSNSPSRPIGVRRLDGARER